MACIVFVWFSASDFLVAKEKSLKLKYVTLSVCFCDYFLSLKTHDFAQSENVDKKSLSLFQQAFTDRLSTRPEAGAAIQLV